MRTFRKPIKVIVRKLNNAVIAQQSQLLFECLQVTAALDFTLTVAGLVTDFHERINSKYARVAILLGRLDHMNTGGIQRASLPIPFGRARGQIKPIIASRIDRPARLLSSATLL